MYMHNKLELVQAQPGSLSIYYTFSSPSPGAFKFSSPTSLLEATVIEPIIWTDDWLPLCMLPKPEVLPVPGEATNFPNGVLFEGTAPGITRVEWK